MLCPEVLAGAKLAIILQPLRRASRGGAAEQAPNAKQQPGDGPAKPSKRAKRKAVQARAQEEAKHALAKAHAAAAKAKSGGPQASGGKGHREGQDAQGPADAA